MVDPFIDDRPVPGETCQGNKKDLRPRRVPVPQVLPDLAQ
jgi:hypothetical protein